MADRRKQAKLDRDATQEHQPLLREVGGVDHVPSVCMTLRMARERAGYDLKDVATVLRIKSSHLEALEAGRYKDLPGPTYVSGFLRTYADYLGLDRNEVLARYREEIGLGSRQKLTFPTPNYERRVPRGWLIIAGIAVAAVAYGGWHYYSTQHSAPAAIVADAPSDPTSDPKLAAGANLAAERADAEQPAVAQATDSAAASKAEEAAASPSATIAASEEKPAVTGGTGAGGSLFDRGGASSATAGSVASTTESTPATEGAAPTGNLFDRNGSGSGAAGAAAGSSLITSDANAAPTESTGPGSRLIVPVVADDEVTPAPTAAVANEPLAPPTEADIAALEGGATEVVPTQADAEPVIALAEPTPTASPEVVAETPATVEAAPAVPSVSEARIVINAKADSWVQIQGPGNELVMTQILRPGESYSVPDRQGLVMTTGNAGGIDLVVDGQTLRTLGPIGVVKRNIALDPEKLRSKYAP